LNHTIITPKDFLTIIISHTLNIRTTCNKLTFVQNNVEIKERIAILIHLTGKAHGLHLIGKREAEPYYGVYGAYPVTSSVITSINPAVTAYANGAIVPTDPIGLAATSAHLNEKAAQAARNILG